LNGDTVARPLFFEFTSDLNTHTIDKQFMIGPALLISPVLEKVSIFIFLFNHKNLD
jgi:alpha-glucosidase (family GH31 glycosyl hydrolase)